MRFLMSFLTLASAAVLSAQSPPAPRDVFFREGTASIAGVIVAADTGMPIPRAIVVLGGGAVAGFTVIADANGRFTFDRLPAGQFTISASKTGFLLLAYGQAEPGRGSALPLELKDGERRADVRWALPRAASISGRILDHAGRPMRGAIVVLHQRRAVEGVLQLATCCGQAAADSNGFYRVTGLMPGNYVVSVIPPGDYNVIPEVLSSYGDETRQTSEEEIRWALREIEIASGRTAAASRVSEPARGRSVSYGRSYFPGTTEADRASVITVKAGEDRRGTDFAMQFLPTAVIRGRVVGPDGQPVANVRYSFSDGWSTATLGLGTDGAFERRNLLPGRYTISVRTTSTPLWGSRVFDVNGVDFTDVVITLGPAASLSGRVVFEPGETPANLATASVQALLRPTGSTLPVRVGADGTFAFPVVDPGRYRLTVSIPVANRGPWILKSAMVAGVDATDTTFEIAPGQAITDAVVTFTSKSTRLTGMLLTADDKPAGGYYVVVFADNPAMWAQGSRRVPPPARASTDGRYTFTGMPAGTYRLAALTSVDANELADPAFLAALKPISISVTIGDGETVTQDVKFARRY